MILREEAAKIGQELFSFHLQKLTEAPEKSGKYLKPEFSGDYSRSSSDPIVISSREAIGKLKTTLVENEIPLGKLGVLSNILESLVVISI